MHMYLQMPNTILYNIYIQNKLLHTIRKGIFTSTILSWILSFITCGIFFGFNSSICYKLLGCISIGLVAGELIAISTEYVTSFAYKPTISIAKKSRIGSASVITQGLGIGMLSTIAPVLIICCAVLGNTTAATGKGFAIGSAVLTALALLAAFKNDSGLTTIDISSAEVLVAAIFGACLPYIFAALTMMAVGRA
eukprot:531957_1